MEPRGAAWPPCIPVHCNATLGGAALPADPPVAERPRVCQREALTGAGASTPNLRDRPRQRYPRWLRGAAARRRVPGGRPVAHRPRPAASAQPKFARPARGARGSPWRGIAEPSIVPMLTAV